MKGLTTAAMEGPEQPRIPPAPPAAPVTALVDEAGVVVGASPGLPELFGVPDPIGRHVSALFGLPRSDGVVAALFEAALSGSAVDRHLDQGFGSSPVVVRPSLTNRRNAAPVLVLTFEVTDHLDRLSPKRAASNGGRLRYEEAIAECSAVLLKDTAEEELNTALEALLAAADASAIFIERNVWDPDQGLCSSLVHQCSLPGLQVDGDYWSHVPWSAMPDSYARLSKGQVFGFCIDDLGPVEAATYAQVRSKSELDAPIFVDGEWAGVIGLTDRRARREWDEEEIRLLRTAAALVGAYWSRQRTRRRLERAVADAETRLRYEHALAECSAELLMSSEEDGLPRALDAMLLATRATYGFIEVNVEDPELGLCSRTLHEAELLADGTLSHEMDDYWALRPWSQMPDSYAVLSTGAAFAFTASDLGPVERQLYLEDPYPIRSELDIPIHVDGEWTGLIGFGDRDETRTWHEDDVRLLKTVADMIGAFWSRTRSRQALEDLVASKDEFLASVSHELRTPLTSVVGLAAELRDRPEDFSPQQRADLVELIADESSEMANLVEDLLVAARADIDVLEVWPEPIDLAAEVRTTVNSLPDSGLVDVRIGANTPALADRTRLRQILRNLVTNAVRYGGPEVVVETDDAGPTPAVRVIDDGPAISAESRDVIFEAYGRAHERGSQPASVGLGLTVSRRLARLMGGDLTYRHDGTQSIFELTLPRPALGGRRSNHRAGPRVA